MIVHREFIERRCPSCPSSCWFFQPCRYQSCFFAVLSQPAALVVVVFLELLAFNNRHPFPYNGTAKGWAKGTSKNMLLGKIEGWSEG